jgi:hypothetical protein
VLVVFGGWFFMDLKKKGSACLKPAISWHVKFSFTGLVGYPSDDINKFLWMVRIGGGEFPHIKEPDYLVSTEFLS